MQILFYFVITLHILVCFFLIGVVLLQQGRSADLAGAFGGQGSQTAFGPRAAANVLTRLTTWSAIIFMCTSIGLVVLFVRSSNAHSVLEGGPRRRPALLPSPASKSVVVTPSYWPWRQHFAVPDLARTLGTYSLLATPCSLPFYTGGIASTTGTPAGGVK